MINDDLIDQNCRHRESSYADFCYTIEVLTISAFLISYHFFGRPVLMILRIREQLSFESLNKTARSRCLSFQEYAYDDTSL
ncbi:hypothetical protein CEXT_478011 [Caerostris extrusa]|uniref:Uncharacterized protein n=1 Tax=Caerostris extrusa TaxID=172846 RepID=A0AAV4TMU4_CAEEX|nr:hypothetical protein CEXT_478011 [Caerostris extrusa]